MKFCKKIFPNAKDAIIVIDSNGIFIEQNDCNRELLEFSDEELLGRTPAVYLGDFAFKKLMQIIADGGICDGAFACHTKTGKALCIEISVSPLRDERHSVIYYAIINRDITDQKKAKKTHQVKNRKILQRI